MPHSPPSSPLSPLLFSPLSSLLLCVCLVSLLSSCANTSTSEQLERSLGADPKLKENPIAFDGSSAKIPQGDTTKPPADFPSQIPLYPNAQLQEVKPLTQSSLGKEGKLTRWTTDAPSNLILNFYQKEFESKNWQIVKPADDNSNTLVASQNNLRVTVSIDNNVATPTPTQTPISIAPSPSPSLSVAGNNTQFLIEYARENTASKPSDTLSADPKQNSTQPNPTAQTDNVFTDINKAPAELRQYIQDLAALGVLNLTATGSKSDTVNQEFEPNKTISRREYSRWLVAANNQIHANNPGKQIRLASETSQPAFGDVPKADPDFAAIQGLAEAGLIPSRLTGENSAVLFRPDAPLTRENLILWKVPLDTRQSLPNAAIEAVKQTWGFQDAAKINPRALRAILADFQSSDSANIRRVFGYTTIFQPQKPVTRAEAAGVLWYFGSQGEGVSAKDALQIKNQSTVN